MMSGKKFLMFLSSFLFLFAIMLYMYMYMYMYFTGWFDIFPESGFKGLHGG